MADPELEAIRQQRLAQLQAQSRGGLNPDEMAKVQEQAKLREEAKHMILDQLLDQSARARLNTLMVAKPEKAKQIEEMLVRMAQSAPRFNKITEAEFIQMLNSVNTRLPSNQTTVKYDRRRAAFDSDDDDY